MSMSTRSKATKKPVAKGRKATSASSTPASANSAQPSTRKRKDHARNTEGDSSLTLTPQQYAQYQQLLAGKKAHSTPAPANKAHAKALKAAKDKGRKYLMNIALC
jgi:hypothetical protein